MSCELAFVVGPPLRLSPDALRARIRGCRVARRAPTLWRGGIVPRLIGLDVHREFAQVVVLEHGAIRQLGRISTTPEALHAFARTLGPNDHVALEATCNTYAIARLLQEHPGRVVVSNPLRTRAIAEAKIKTDKVDAEAWYDYWREAAPGGVAPRRPHADLPAAGVFFTPGMPTVETEGNR